MVGLANWANNERYGLPHAFVPLLYLGVSELSVVLQVVQNLRLQFAVLFPHPAVPASGETRLANELQYVVFLLLYW